MLEAAPQGWAFTVPTALDRVRHAIEAANVTHHRKHHPTNFKPLLLQGLRLWRTTLLNQTGLSPSKTFKFMEKYMEQLKEATLSSERKLVQLWRKEGIPRYVQSFILKTKIANIEVKLANWSVMVINDKSFIFMLF